MVTYSKYNAAFADRSAKTFSFRRAGFIFFGLTTGVLMLLFALDWAKSQPIFVLENILVEGNHFVGSKEILQLAKIESKKHLFEIDLLAVESRIERHPLVKKATVSRRLPGSIVVNICEREPLAELDGLAVDYEGKRLTKLSIKTLDVLPEIFELEYSGARDANPKLKTILAFLSFLKIRYAEVYNRISKISYSQNQGVYFHLSPANAKVVVGDEDFEARLENFLKTWDYLETRNQIANIEYFDLRFNQQVVVKATGKS
jgi:cell division protein FtsQ